MRKEKSGISLIVLVITIIVIIILAVAVILSIANNNPISNANDAVKSNDTATLKEAATLAYAQWYTENALGSVSEEPQAYVERVLREKNFTPEQIARVTVETDGKITIAEAGSSVATGWDGSIDTSWYNETDTTFNLSTEAQFAGLAKLVNDGTDTFAGKTINLTSDMNMNNLEWTPIGHYDRVSYKEYAMFEGKFDGQNHIISNIKITNTVDSGIFGYAGQNSETLAYLKNTILKDSYVKGTYVAGIVTVFNTDMSASQANRAYIENCATINCYIEGSESAGGIANYIYYSNLKNCYNSSEIVCTYSGNSELPNNNGFAGGIYAGGIDAPGIFNCYNSGKVSSVNGYVGGIVGGEDSPYIINSYNTGEISGGIAAGGISGLAYNPSLYNCYNVGTITGQTKGSLIGYLGNEEPTDNNYYIKNCYYLSGTEAFGFNSGLNTQYPEDTVLENVTEITEDNLKLADAITFLNSNGYSEYVQDTNNINNGFPILSWQQ